MTGLRARRATGLLGDFDAAGVLVPADVHVAVRLGVLSGETDERVLLALALTVRSTRHGSVVLDLSDVATTTTPDVDGDESFDVTGLPWPDVAGWIAACVSSPLTDADDGGAPLHVVGSRLWLDRYWSQETLVADELRRRSAKLPDDLDPDRLAADLAALFPADSDADQRAATRAAAGARVSVIGGGPGTGKTTTIARLIAVLRRQHPNLRIALAAPTGKAAARLEEAVRSASGALSAADRDQLTGMTAATLHRLLGWRPGAAGRFRHDRENPLTHDVVIVDECSMVPLTMMARLLEALAPHARLVLVGDPDQLASVEAGAVLGDIVAAAGAGAGAVQETQPAGAPGAAGAPAARSDEAADSWRGTMTLLRTVHRFDAGGPIAQLADHVRAGRSDEACDMLRAQPDGIEFCTAADDEPVTGDALRLLRDQVGHELTVVTAAREGDVPGALDALDRHRLLCAHRGGPRGVQHWSDELHRRLVERDPLVVPRLDGRYAGQPLLVILNDYENGLFNGDTGVVVAHGDDLVAAFRRGGVPVTLPLVRLSDVRPMHAMTVHRAQGSQFDEVTVLLPAASSPLATRQTLYTAITRAARRVRVIGSLGAVAACVDRPAARATGLRERLLGELR